MIRLVRALTRDRRGGVGVLIAVMLPVLIGIAAFAIDLGAIQLDSRRLQGIADGAALAAANAPDTAQQAATDFVAAAGYPRPITVVTTPGRYDASLPLRQRFVAGDTPAQAVKVTLSSRSPTFLARIFDIGWVTIRRSATATQTNYAAFSVGSGLLSLQGGLLNALLSGLTGSSISLSVMDYQALAGAQVDLLGYIQALRTTANLGVATYDDTLKAKVTTPQLINALADALGPGDGAQADALRGIALKVKPLTVSLDSLINLGPLGEDRQGGLGTVRTDALSLLSALVQTGNENRQIKLNLGASVPGLVDTQVWLAIGQRPNSSPWIAITDKTETIISTAQTRIYVSVSLGNVSIPGVGTLLALKVPLFVELASAQAKLHAIDCTDPRSVTIDARPGAGKIAIADLDPAKLADFSTPMTLSNTKILNTLILDIETRAVIDLGSSENWQPLRFTQRDIDEGTVKSAYGKALVQSIAKSLISGISLTIHLLGLPIDLQPVVQLVGYLLGGLAPILDGLIDALTGLLGLHLGQADVRVTGVRCGAASLVA